MGPGSTKWSRGSRLALIRAARQKVSQGDAMRIISPVQLAPDEIAFCLETNGEIDARRFLDFIEDLAFSGTHRAPLLPSYDVHIVELSTGSFFGRLRFGWNTEDTDEGRLRKLERELAVLRAEMDEFDDRDHRDLTAAERAAIAAEASVAEARANNRTQNRMLAVMTATLLFSYLSDARSEDETRSGTVLTAIMDGDGVSSLNLYCNLGGRTLLRQDVGVILRHEGDDTVNALGTSEAREANEAVALKPRWVDLDDDGVDTGTGRDINFHEAREDGFRPSTQPPMTADEEPGIPWPQSIRRHSDSNQTIEPNHGGGIPLPPRGNPVKWHREHVMRFGSFVDRGDTWTLLVDEGRDKGRKIAVLLPAGSEIIGGMRYRVEDDMFQVADAPGLIIAETCAQAPGLPRVD